MTLLRDIQQDAIGEDTSVSVLLRQCLVLSARLQHDQLREWAQLELNGYPGDASLPPYRADRLGQRSKGEQGRHHRAAGERERGEGF